MALHDQTLNRISGIKSGLKSAVPPTAKLPESWTVQSWRNYPVRQQPDYEDERTLLEILNKISKSPPIVSPESIHALQDRIASAAAGECFILQGGDCAERFQDCQPEVIDRKIQILIQMATLLQVGVRKPICTIGRIAGQYAKPRSSQFDTLDDMHLPVFRGDSINSFDATMQARKPDPERLWIAYQKSRKTYNQVAKYKSSSDPIYISHEGLHLAYEESMTREWKGRFYNLGAHMIWLGERTRHLGEAHMEYFRGIQNPIAVKLGPQTTVEELLKTIRILNPENIEGRLTLITRLGAGNVESLLPLWIERVREQNLSVAWSVDPMHGNLIWTKNRMKTRDFQSILLEVRHTFAAHRRMNNVLAGVHFEMTGDSVTECVGGSQGLREEDLAIHYETYCDPRLNAHQSLEMASLISGLHTAFDC